ncbi:MAG TPA: hypothetical protein VGE20_00695 [Ramlibacter sp.]
MFDRIRKALARTAPAAPSGMPDTRPSPAADAPASQRAATRGLSFTADGAGGAALEGRVQGRPWRLERGKPTRDYVVGEELRARAELALHEDVAAMVMNRALKEALESKAFEQSTDQLQTTIDGNLPQEVRWLAMFDEFVWEGPPAAFWDRYAVVADRRETAVAWIDAALAQQLLDWPAPAPSPQAPFTLLLLRGRAYLRMEYRPANLPTLQHAALVFTSACESALRAPVDVALE